MRKIVKAFLHLSLLALLPQCVSAQGYGVVKGDCTPVITGGESLTRGEMQHSRRYLREPNNHWDANRVYRQLVILVSYSDTEFIRENPNNYYDRLLNEPGFNERSGVGCMADYFREQSNGLFNLHFDVYGPYQVSSKAQPYPSPNANTRNYGNSSMSEATTKMIAENPTLDYSQYDWDGDGIIEQVIYIMAGISGNQGQNSYGYVWPNTSSFSTIFTPDGMRISSYSCSAECWTGTSLCGIGTICHEYSHCLGLPDIYPTTSSSGYYSVADEWDLMDGGNFTNAGWCPPNYTALEKMLLGWLTPVELNEPTTVTGLKSVSDGGESYIIKHTDTEYLLLENRQWTGWDAGVPGHGLVIYHVDYNESNWAGNSVNSIKGHFRFDLVHADNLDYEQWDVIQPRSSNQWTEKTMMHNRHLSSSPYPWATDSTTFVNCELTDTSTPSTVMYNTNAEGSRQLSKPITNIQMTDDGLVSFDFMGGEHSAIFTAVASSSASTPVVYHLSGQILPSGRGRGLCIERSVDGTVRKLFFK